MSIPQPIIDEVRQRISFIDVASEFVTLKRAGRTYVGLCPFHKEKTPSFHVNEEEGFYKCFGCGKKGSVYNFVMELKGYTFPEAVKTLAKQVGVTVPEYSKRATQDSQRRSELNKTHRGVLRCCAEVYRREMIASNTKAEEARAYLRKRGITEATEGVFKIGLAPDKWEFVHGAVSALINSETSASKLSPDEITDSLLTLGLIKRREADTSDQGNPSYYDSFRQRILFPITRSDGCPIAFGGRVFGTNDSKAKYINSPESVLYQKRKAFYGLDVGLPSIRKDRHLILVEGYMDVISLYQQGITNSLAGCGTAITEEQAQLLSRVADRVTLLFDGDEAGRKAAASCFSVFINSGLEVQSVALPDGQDPDSLVQEVGAERFMELLRTKSTPVLHAYIDYMIGAEESADKHFMNDAARMGKIAAEFAKTVSHTKNPVERDLYLQQSAERLGVSLSSINELVMEEIRRTRERDKMRVAAPKKQMSEPAPSPSRSSALLVNKPTKAPTPKPLPAQSASRSAAAEKFSTISRQLVIAILSEPSLAPSILEMPTLVERVQDGNYLSEQVLAFVSEASAGDWVGISDIVQLDEDAAAYQEGIGFLENKLLKHSLHSMGLLEEALRQSQVGGSNSKGLVGETAQAVERINLKVDLDEIRGRESEAEETGQRELLAQEKLLKKRNLEKLRQGR